MVSHPIVHVDFTTDDTKATGEFCKELFGWQLHHDAQFDYLMFGGEPGPGGGFVKPDGDQTHTGEAFVYVGSDDIDGTLRRAEELGGTIAMPKTELPGTGWMAVVAMPGGGRVGLYQNMQG